MLGLPFALFTQSMHYIPEPLARIGPVPSGVIIQKYYFKPDIDILQEQAVEARSLGVAAAEEWYKGLSDRGQQVQNDAARFEQWELNRGLANARSVLVKLSSNLRGEGRVLQHAPNLPNRPHVTVAPLPGEYQRPSFPTTLPPVRQYGVPPGLETSCSMPPMQSDSASMGSQQSTGVHKASKSSRERAKIRSYKKQDIISRCSRLNPPMSIDMLERLDAYDAALQVSIPLNDSSWDTLKGRLLQQRHKITLEDEAKNAARTAPVPGQFRPPSRSDDFMLAQADTSRREKLCQVAEEFIKQKYGYGGWVTFPTAPQFAADVLIHTRQKYVEEEARTRSLQEQTGTITFEDPLKLEDMKWVFEQTIKPRTEQIRKDLFICPECPVQGTVKHFAFESIIQHYASKHTTAFSVGNQKVSWKAEWPETSPFTAHPERVHTPTPSITHTPTLSHPPLSVMSPGSVLTSTIQSAGWRSPDTMSLMSGTTNTFSIAGSLTNRRPVLASAPGYGMYEVQRDMLSTELLRGWAMVPRALPMSDSLHLHIAIASASTNFNGQYRNQPSLDLFADCVNTKAELRDLQGIDNLRCAECFVTDSPHLGAVWSLQDLIIHFRKAHGDHNPSASKPDWRNDMVALPEPAIVKSLQATPNLVVGLRELLQDAVTASTLKSVQSNIPVLELAPRSRSPHSLLHGRNNRPTYFGHPTSHAAVVEDAPFSSAHTAGQVAYPRRFVSSTAATYGDRTSARDSWSTTSRTIKDEEFSEYNFRIRPSIETYEQRQRVVEPLFSAEPGEGGTRARDQVVDMPHTRGEAMSRSETVRSYHSRGGQHAASIADDFLSTIDAHVDVEMADSGLGGARSARASHPVSRSGSAVRPAIDIARREMGDREAAIVSRAPFYCVEHADTSAHEDSLQRLHDPRAYMEQFQRDGRPPKEDAMQRQPSNVVEFDHHGTPIPRSGLVYHEVSPFQHVIARPRVVDNSRPSEQLAYSRPSQGLREVPPEPTRHSHHRTISDYPYSAVEYLQTPLYRREQIHEPAAGLYYSAERPSFRHHGEIEEEYGRVYTMYDASGRAVQYQEIDQFLPRRDELEYDSYHPDIEERRYQER